MVLIITRFIIFTYVTAIICNFYVPHNAICFLHKILYIHCFPFSLGVAIVSWAEFENKTYANYFGRGEQIASWGMWKSQILSALFVNLMDFFFLSAINGDNNIP